MGFRLFSCVFGFPLGGKVVFLIFKLSLRREASFFSFLRLPLRGKYCFSRFWTFPPEGNVVFLILEVFLRGEGYFLIFCTSSTYDSTFPKSYSLEVDESASNVPRCLVLYWCRRETKPIFSERELCCPFISFRLIAATNIDVVVGKRVSACIGEILVDCRSF